jgi:hypothetical protein
MKEQGWKKMVSHNFSVTRTMAVEAEYPALYKFVLESP